MNQLSGFKYYNLVSKWEEMSVFLFDNHYLIITYYLPSFFSSLQNRNKEIVNATSRFYFWSDI